MEGDSGVQGRWQRLLGGSSHQDSSAPGPGWCWGAPALLGTTDALYGQRWSISTASGDAAVTQELTKLSPEAWTMASQLPYEVFHICTTHWVKICMSESGTGWKSLSLVRDCFLDSPFVLPCLIWTVVCP